MNTESITCRKVPYGEMKQVVDFCFDPEFEFIYLWVPGVSGPDSLQIQRGSPGGERVWGWDGNEDQPTLSPSIHTPGCWHGYMRKGRLESC